MAPMGCGPPVGPRRAGWWWALAALAGAGTAGGWEALDWGMYTRMETLLGKVREIVAANPGTMKLEVVTASGDQEGFAPGKQGYSTEVLVVTVEVGGAAADPAAKARVLANYGEHAREVITSEIALRLLTTLASEDGIKAAMGGGAAGDQAVAALKNTVLKIIPMEATHSRKMVEAGDVCRRVNGRGVDPNRNWDWDWGVREKDYMASEEYGGPRAFSEPEVKIIHELVTSWRPHAWVNVHSGMAAMFSPLDYVTEVAEDYDLHNFRVLGHIQEHYCDECLIGSGGATVGYKAHGTAVDYMHNVMKIPFTTTWEVYGDTEAHFDDCVRMFNPLSRERYELEVDNWSKALLATVRLLPLNRAVPAYEGWQDPGPAAPFPFSRVKGLGSKLEQKARKMMDAVGQGGPRAGRGAAPAVAAGPSPAASSSPTVVRTPAVVQTPAAKPAEPVAAPAAAPAAAGARPRPAAGAGGGGVSPGGGISNQGLISSFMGDDESGVMRTRPSPLLARPKPSPPPRALPLYDPNSRYRLLLGVSLALVLLVLNRLVKGKRLRAPRRNL